MIDADYLAHSGKLIFSAPGLIKAVEFAISGRDFSVLEITTESNVSGIKVYAPKVRKVKVNNKEHKFAIEGNYIVIRNEKYLAK